MIIEKYFQKKDRKNTIYTKCSLLLLHEVEELLQTLSQNNLLTLETLIPKETLKKPKTDYDEIFINYLLKHIFTCFCYG